MADTLRGSMDAAEYKHVVLGLQMSRYNRRGVSFRAVRLTRTLT